VKGFSAPVPNHAIAGRVEADKDVFPKRLTADVGVPAAFGNVNNGSVEYIGIHTMNPFFEVESTVKERLTSMHCAPATPKSAGSSGVVHGPRRARSTR
jgi:hypothetical protein